MKTTAFIAVAATSALVLAGCSAGNDGASDDVASYDTIVVQTSAAPQTLDPAKGSTNTDSAASTASYDTLVNRDNGEIIPGLAESWNVTPTSVTFTLKERIVCSDGTEIDGADVAASLTRFFDPETAAPLAGAARGAGQATVTGSAQEVVVEVSEPYADLLASFTLPSTGIICPAGLANPDALATESFGTGPYVLADQVAGSSYTYELRDEYTWGPDYTSITAGTRPATLTLKVVEDESTAANLLDAGDVQIAMFGGADWQRFEGQDYTLSTIDQALSFLMLNHLDGAITTDIDVRKAIMQAVDRERLNDIETLGTGALLDNLGTSNYACYDDSTAKLLPKYDADAAAKVLAGTDLRILGLAGSQSGDYLLTSLSEAGANVTLEDKATGDWAATLFSKPETWDVAVLKFLNIADSISYTGAYFSGTPVPDGQNLSSIVSPENDAALAGSHALTGEDQCASVTEFVSSLFSNYDVLPLTTIPSTVVSAPGIEYVAGLGAIESRSIMVSEK
jgi:peptide/nickel transport system substrate-binding protein